MVLKIQRTEVETTVAGLVTAICEIDFRFKSFTVLELEAIGAGLLSGIEDNGRLTVSEENYRKECQRRFIKFSPKKWENAIKALRLGGIIVPFWTASDGEKFSDWFLETIETPLPRDSYIIPYSLLVREGIEIQNQSLTNQ